MSSSPQEYRFGRRPFLQMSGLIMANALLPQAPSPPSAPQFGETSYIPFARAETAVLPDVEPITPEYFNEEANRIFKDLLGINIQEGFIIEDNFMQNMENKDRVLKGILKTWELYGTSYQELKSQYPDTIPQFNLFLNNFKNIRIYQEEDPLAAGTHSFEANADGTRSTKLRFNKDVIETIAAHEAAHAILNFDALSSLPHLGHVVSVVKEATSMATEVAILSSGTYLGNPKTTVIPEYFRILDVRDRLVKDFFFPTEPGKYKQTLSKFLPILENADPGNRFIFLMKYIYGSRIAKAAVDNLTNENTKDNTYLGVLGLIAHFESQRKGIYFPDNDLRNNMFIKAFSDAQSERHISLTDEIEDKSLGTIACVPTYNVRTTREHPSIGPDPITIIGPEIKTLTAYYDKKTATTFLISHISSDGNVTPLKISNPDGSTIELLSSFNFQEPKIYSGVEHNQSYHVQVEVQDGSVLEFDATRDTVDGLGLNEIDKTIHFTLPVKFIGAQGVIQTNTEILSTEEVEKVEFLQNTFQISDEEAIAAVKKYRETGPLPFEFDENVEHKTDENGNEVVVQKIPARVVFV